MLPWECENCNHKEIASPFITFENCPKCGSDCFYHGQMIDDEEEEEEEDDEDEDEDED